MVVSLLHLTLIFIFLSILLLVSTIYSKIWWWLKAFLIVISAFFFYSSYTTVESLLGRPTQQSLADESTLLLHISETPSNSNEGRILLLIKDKENYRLHQLPYSKELDKKLRDAMQQARKSGGIPKKIIIKLKNGARGNSTNNEYPEIYFDLNLKEIVLPEKDSQ